MTTAAVLDIEVVFNFSRNGNNRHSENECFDAADESLETTIALHGDELVDELNDDLDDDADEWVYDGYEIVDYDADWYNPDQFVDLNDYGAYATLIEKHGEAYHLRYDDVGENSFEDEYQGCFDSVEDFARHIADECYGYKAPSWLTVDWERTARDLMMDYSSYDGNDGVHIFRS